MLDFTIEEEQPVVYLVVGNRPGRTGVSEKRFWPLRWDGTEGLP